MTKNNCQICVQCVEDAVSVGRSADGVKISAYHNVPRKLCASHASSHSRREKKKRNAEEKRATAALSKEQLQQLLFEGRSDADRNGNKSK
jgi:hypothetical protein